MRRNMNEDQRDFLLAQAEQDQQWMALDEWAGRTDNKECIAVLVKTLDNEPSAKVLAAMRKLDKHTLEVVRLLALHTLRELMLREHAAQERAKEDPPDTKEDAR